MSIDNTNSLTRGTPGLFTPTVVRSLEEPSNESISLSLSTPAISMESSIDSTGSFKYNLPNTGLRSTQQLKVDWSNFSNHTFFNSAQVKVNVAFDKILNGFPFDGNQGATETFIDSLTGFEKYVFDSYPRSRNYLFLSGTKNGYESAGGTYITVVDKAGAAYTDMSTNTSGQSIINPRLNSMTFEYWINIPAATNDNQIILDKHSGSLGFAVVLNSTTLTTFATSSIYIVSASSVETTQVIFPKNQWNHIAWAWNRTPGYNGITTYLNGKPYGSSSIPVEFDIIDVTSNMYIGSGSAIAGFVPTNTLSGALDELRIWHSVRSADEIYQNYQKSVFASPDLKAYYKFNEPSGSMSQVTIDASSNSLHGNLNYYAYTVLNTRNVSTGTLWSSSSPVLYEDINLCPNLFPNHPDVVNYRTSFYASASIYDYENPNLITKLIPKHYLFEGQTQDSLDTEEGSIVNSLTTGTDPRSTRLGGTQTLLLLLYTWAKFFDEMKLYTQAFSDINFVDYNETDTVPDQFLQRLAQSQGIDLPPLWTGASVDQFINAQNYSDTPDSNLFSLQFVQNQIWRRILINLRDIVTSKGTVYAVKAFIRAIGIDPDNNFRIREYGGPTSQNLGFVRDKRNEVSSILSFISGGLVKSPYLSGSRSEPGYPQIAGSANDGLFTSGSWTYEATYKHPLNRTYPQYESLVRFMTTGSSLTSSGALIANLVSFSGSYSYPTSTTSSLTLYVRPNSNSSSPYVTLNLPGVDIYDGDKWYISFGKRRNDDELNSVISSSYFLRAAKNINGEIFSLTTTSSWFNDYAGGGINIWNQKNSTLNSSGSFFVIGSGSIDTSVTSFLNSPLGAPSKARETKFNGDVSYIRFWSKYLNDSEFLEHIRNVKSLGVQDPLTNFNFVTNKSSSWERLRIDANVDQAVTQSNTLGKIDIFDFSQNNFHLSGTQFPTGSQVINAERYFYSYISPKIDEASTTNKIRIRSFEKFENVQQTPWAQVTPVFEIPRFEEPTDSTKFTIDFSIVDALNQDIIAIFSTLDELDNILGNPELVFSPDYPGLENLRNVYFNRLTDKINLKNFFDFFQWFDTNIGTFVSQLIPKKTKFYGTNFVIESHMLERPKFQYLFEEIYLGDSSRSSLRDTILLQLFVAKFVRY